MVKKVLNTTGIVILICSIIIFNLIIGANEKNLPILAICVLLGFSSVVLILKKIIFKENIIIKNKIDVAVLSFMVCLSMPLLFKIYCTYQGTVEFIIKYLFVYSQYLLIRNFVDTKQKVNVLIITTILSSLIFIILGIDLKYGNYLSKIIDVFKLKYENVDEFASTFGYANAVAIYLLFCVYLAINRIENCVNKKVILLYIAYIILAIIIIFLTSSRVVIILFIASCLGYFCFKNYKKIFKNKKIVISTILMVLVISILFVVYVIIAMQYPKPCPLKTFQKIKKQFIPNNNYTITLEFDIENLNSENQETKIQIVQVNKYFQEKVLASKVLEDNILKMKFIPTDSVYYLKLQVDNIGQKKIMINKCYINDSEYVFRSKYMPYTLFSFIKAFYIQDEGILQRTQFYKACIEMSKEHPLIGNGGNTWKKLYWVYQEYPYYIKESHSYFFELLISYGMVGLVSFLSILITFYITIIKEIKNNKDKRKQKISILIGFTVLLLHSLLFDFNMSFIIVILAVFNYIALLQYGTDNNLETKKYFKDIIDYSVLIVFIILTMTLVQSNIAKYLYETYKLGETNGYIADYKITGIAEKSKNKENILPNLKEFIKKEPYYHQNDIYNIYWNELFNKMNNLSKEEFKDYIMFGINNYKKIPCEKTMDYNLTISRAKMMVDIVNVLKKIDTEYFKNAINELEQLIEKEYDKNIINLKDCERNQLTEEESKEIIQKYELILGKK